LRGGGFAWRITVGEEGGIPRARRHGTGPRPRPFPEPEGVVLGPDLAWNPKARLGDAGSQGPRGAWYEGSGFSPARGLFIAVESNRERHNQRVPKSKG